MTERLDELLRVASPAAAAPMLWHYLKDPADPIRRVHCGEVRRAWLPVEAFVAPEAFEPCPVCAGYSDSLPVAGGSAEADSS